MILGLFNYPSDCSSVVQAEILTSLEPLSLTAFINDSLDSHWLQSVQRLPLRRSLI